MAWLMLAAAGLLEVVWAYAMKLSDGFTGTDEKPTRMLRKDLMDDDEFRELQTYLLEAHERGDTISHTGGCRKIRWSRPGMGKRGGVRVIYYLRLASGRL